MMDSSHGGALKHPSDLLDRLTDRTPGLLLTTNPGLEDIVAAEAAEKLPIHGSLCERRPRGVRGLLLILPGRLNEQTLMLARQLQTIHHIIEPRYAFRLGTVDPLAQIRSTLRNRGLGAEPLGAGSFRVTTKRHGEHGFSSLDVQRCAGAGLIDRFGNAVDLINFDTQVRVDVWQDVCIVGRQWTRERLSKRPWQLEKSRASLRANVAHAMWRLSGLEEGVVLDPFCGGGTIPIEAACYRPGLRIVASDHSSDAIVRATRNMAAAGVGDRIILTQADVRHLDQAHAAASFDGIVTNPPFGIRVGKGMDFHAFYRTFLHSAAHLLKPGGRLVFLAWKRGAVVKANQEKRYFKRVHVRVIETGGIYPRLYVMERR